MTDWRDISTAPKTLLDRPSEHRILVTRWPSTTHPPVNIVYWGKGKYSTPRWLICGKKALRYQPTHWKPLDPPPQA